MWNWSPPHCGQHTDWRAARRPEHNIQGVPVYFKRNHNCGAILQVWHNKFEYGTLSPTSSVFQEQYLLVVLNYCVICTVFLNTFSFSFAAPCNKFLTLAPTDVRQTAAMMEQTAESRYIRHDWRDGCHGDGGLTRCRWPRGLWASFGLKTKIFKRCHNFNLERSLNNLRWVGAFIEIAKMLQPGIELTTKPQLWKNSDTA